MEKKSLWLSALWTETAVNFRKTARVPRGWQGVHVNSQRRSFALCESPSVENWRTVAAAFMRLLLVLLHSGGSSLWVNDHRRRIDEPPAVLMRRLFGLLIGTHRAGSGQELVSRFCFLTPLDRFVHLSVAISVLIRVSLQPYSQVDPCDIIMVCRGKKFILFGCSQIGNTSATSS